MAESNQENKQLLLNAIKHKFTGSTNSSVTQIHPPEAPKFTIPILKSATSPSQLEASSKLNQFILGQLSELSGELSTGGFTLPKLQTNDVDILQQGATKKFVIPLLSNTIIPNERTKATTATINSTSSYPISALSNSLKDLTVADDCKKTPFTKTSVIDLTAALSIPAAASSSSSTMTCRLETRPSHAPEQFKIPFIECDRPHVAKAVLLPTANEYCRTDISTLKLRHSLVQPSPFGRIVCLKYRCTRPMPRIDHSFKVKHKIQRFRFDTKSPDDVVLASLNKATRQSHT